MKLVGEYVWHGGNNELRSKTRVFDHNAEDGKLSIDNIPEWNYDGSSTGQADTENSEVCLKPVALFRDPFRTSQNCFLVLCETETVDGTPLSNNHRRWANEIFKDNVEEHPW